MNGKGFKDTSPLTKAGNDNGIIENLHFLWSFRAKTADDMHYSDKNKIALSYLWYASVKGQKWKYIFNFSERSGKNIWI